jgi:hypothetical protein
MEPIEIEPDPVILMTGEDWAKMFDHVILDHDGWRLGDGVLFHSTRITEESYRRRYQMCTVLPRMRENGKFE